MNAPRETPFPRTQHSSRDLPGVKRLLDVIDRLRGEGGCPWDRKQTLATLKPYLVEECYELLDAIDSGDVDQHAEELGDVLLQLTLQARIRKEEGAFDFDTVADRLAGKLIHRHPHVFGDLKVDGADQVLRNWDQLKAKEKPERESALDGVPRALPALQRAQHIQGRAARVGFDWDKIDDVIAKVDEELGEVREALAEKDSAAVQEEIGDVLFAVVNLCRFVDTNAEEALHGTISKFTRRFQEIEKRLAAKGREMKDCTLAEMDAEWDAVKAEE